MQIILLKKIGKLGSGINTVKNGYARYLLLQKSAIPCTPENIQSFKDKISFYEAEQKKQDAEINKLCAELNERFVFITSPVNETGNLYGSIRPTEIVEEIKKQLNNSDLIKNQHIVVNNITRPGIFNALLIFTREQTAKINIVVANSENSGREAYLQHIGADSKKENNEQSKDDMNNRTKNPLKRRIIKSEKDISESDSKETVINSEAE